MDRRLVLWDVDGTLLRSTGVAQKAFDLAAERVLGRHPGAHEVRMSGKTDPLIALEILTFAGLAEGDALTRVPEVIEHLEAELAAARELVRSQGHLLPGVEAVLSCLHGRPHVLQSVLTGNTAANAAVKLGAFELDRWLDLEVGAFGSDHIERDRLVPVALERAERRRGHHVEPRDVWVVGDTPRDLACARAGGARCLLVATGRIPIEELDAAGPDHVVEDLGDTSAICEMLAS